VINPDDQSPNAPLAHTIRMGIETDGMVSRPPSQEQFDFLQDLRSQRWNRGGGYPIA
jgi:hypothetical protein